MHPAACVLHVFRNLMCQSPQQRQAIKEHHFTLGCVSDQRGQDHRQPHHCRDFLACDRKDLSQVLPFRPFTKVIGPAADPAVQSETILYQTSRPPQTIRVGNRLHDVPEEGTPTIEEGERRQHGDSLAALDVQACRSIPRSGVIHYREVVKNLKSRAHIFHSASQPYSHRLFHPQFHSNAE